MTGNMIDSYDALPLGLYERLLSLEGDENEVTLGALALLAGTSVDELTALPLEDYYKIRAKGAFLLLQPEPRPVRDAYRVGGWELVPVRSVKRMTAAQFIDFSEWSRQEGRHGAELLSCFLVPKGMQYGEGYDVEEVIDAIRDHLPVADAVALDGFFFHLSLRSILVSLSSLERTLTPLQRMTRTARRMRRALRDLRRSGAGWRRWTPLLSLPARLGGRSTASR